MIPATLAAAPAAAELPARPASPWPVFWVASVAVFLVSLDTTMLYAAFAALRAGFPAASAADMSWVLNAYTVVYAAMLIPAGGLADTHGSKARVHVRGDALHRRLCDVRPGRQRRLADRRARAAGRWARPCSRRRRCRSCWRRFRRAVAL